jgi:hypothetical protein
MAASLLGLGLALHGGTALAQSSPNPAAWDRNWPGTPYSSTPMLPPVAPTAPASVGDTGTTMQFHRSPLLPPTTPASVGGTSTTIEFHRGPAQPGSVRPPGAASPNAATIQLATQKNDGKLDKGLPKTGYEAMEFRSPRELPGWEVITRLESESALKERMRQELLRSGERIVFPDEPVVAKEPYKGRRVEPLTKLVEPNFVVHGRLLFEQPNFERGQWDFGVLGPVLSVGKFYTDIALLPYHVFTRPLQCYDTSAGKCLPGDPAPFRVEPFEFSLTGLAAEAGAITALYFIFP